MNADTSSPKARLDALLENEHAHRLTKATQYREMAEDCRMAAVAHDAKAAEYEADAAEIAAVLRVRGGPAPESNVMAPVTAGVAVHAQCDCSSGCVGKRLLEHWHAFKAELLAG